MYTKPEKTIFKKEGRFMETGFFQIEQYMGGTKSSESQEK